ncbi:hypothetical protein M8494_33070 [Serratia ureilytica]
MSAVRQVTARIRRITLSDTMDKFARRSARAEPASWVRCSSRGATRWRTGLHLSGIDKLARTFDIDMVLHGEPRRRGTGA